MPPSTKPVVVAVGSRGSTAAVEYAADEAVREHRGLHVVHAVETAALEAAGVDVLDRAVRDATGRLPGSTPVTSWLTVSSPVPAVLAASTDAALVVVGRCSESARTHPYVRSVTGGVAARALVPVVSVPDDWADTPASHHVVIGIDDPSRSDQVLLEAFVAARALHARLTIVSTWWRPTGAGKQPLTQVDDPDRSERVRVGLDQLAADLSLEYPDVPVDLQVWNKSARAALIEASRDATLLVLGRHDPLLPNGSHLGPVARAVLREATSPVLLATPRLRHGVHRTIARQEQVT